MDPITDLSAPEDPLVPEAPLAPHRIKQTPMEWAQENLFSTPANSIVSVIFGLLLGYAAFKVVGYVFISARWEILYVNMTNVLVGFFPREDLNIAWFALFVITMGISLMVGAGHQLVKQSDEEVGILTQPMRTQAFNAAKRFAPLIGFVVAMLWLARVERFKAGLLILVLVGIGWAVRTVGLRLPRERAGTATAIGGALIAAAFIGLASQVGWEEWGGLLLTIFLATAAITLCFPIGLLAALGRRSKLPVIRSFSVGYIELIRGVPLITLLFMGSLALRFFMPESVVPSGVTRAVIMITLFSGAYVAEIVRGGLQAVHKGQSEAAMALGLPKTKELRLIILPQALRNVIPALVGQFISLFKDTSLVAIIGMRDLLLVTQGLTKQPEFNGTGVEAEVLTIAAFIYWVFAFTMSRESQRLEGRLGVGTR